MNTTFLLYVQHNIWNVLIIKNIYCLKFNCILSGNSTSEPYFQVLSWSKCFFVYTSSAKRKDAEEDICGPFTSNSCLYFQLYFLPFSQISKYDIPVIQPMYFQSQRCLCHFFCQFVFCTLFCLPQMFLQTPFPSPKPSHHPIGIFDPLANA